MRPYPLLSLAALGMTAFLSMHGTPASAQVTATINLTTTANKSCVATTTDPDGVHLAQNGTNLEASQVTLSGDGCGGGSGGTGNPPTTPFVLTSSPSPLVATVGTPFTVNWTLSGGAAPISCAGSFTGAPVGALMSNWVQSATATVGLNSRQVTPVAADVGGGTAPVSFSLTLTCSNGDGAITSSTLPITINPVDQGGGDCPANRLTNANLCYYNVNKSCTSDGGANNLTTFPIWLGRYSPSPGVIVPAQPPYPEFPGPTGTGPTFSINQGQYISALFTVPMDVTVGRTGKFTKAFGNISNYTNADFAISTTCGDFDSASIPSACKGFNVPNDGVGIRWKIDTTASGYCRLNRGSTYYLNIRPVGCTNGTCLLRIDG